MVAEGEGKKDFARGAQAAAGLIGGNAGRGKAMQGF